MLKLSYWFHSNSRFLIKKNENISMWNGRLICWSIGIKGKCKNWTDLFMQSRTLLWWFCWITLLWSENLVTTRSFSHGQCYVSLPHINQSHVSQSTFLLVSQNRFTRTSTPEGPRDSAFCFRKAIDSVGDHYTSRVHVSSTTSFHPVNAYVGQCFPFGVQGRRQPKFLLQHLLAEQFNFRCCWDKEEKYEEVFIFIS